jgi:hypothetical protein
MSKKIVIILLTIFFNFTIYHSVFGLEDLKIIKRSQWGADETLRYVDSSEWKSYYDNLNS